MTLSVSSTAPVRPYYTNPPANHKLYAPIQLQSGTEAPPGTQEISNILLRQYQLASVQVLRYHIRDDGRETNSLHRARSGCGLSLHRSQNSKSSPAHRVCPQPPRRLGRNAGPGQRPRHRRLHLRHQPDLRRLHKGGQNYRPAPKPPIFRLQDHFLTQPDRHRKHAGHNGL